MSNKVTLKISLEVDRRVLQTSIGITEKNFESLANGQAATFLMAKYSRLFINYLKEQGIIKK